MHIVITIIIITISTRPHFGTDLCFDTSPDPLGISSESQSGLLERDPNMSPKEVGKLSTVTSLWATRITSYSRRAVSPLRASTQLPGCVCSQGPWESILLTSVLPSPHWLRRMWKGLGPTCLRSQISFQSSAQDRSLFMVETDASVPVTELQAKSSSSEQGKGKTSLYITLSYVWSQSKCQDQPSNEARQMYTKDLLHQF